MDENNEQFVAYFVPTQETLKKRQRDAQDSVSYQEGEEYVICDARICLQTSRTYVYMYIICRYEYRLTREYNWNVKNKASKGYEVSLLL